MNLFFHITPTISLPFHPPQLLPELQVLPTVVEHPSANAFFTSQYLCGIYDRNANLKFFSYNIAVAGSETN